MDSAELDRAKGTLRDGLAALHNFLHLLASHRVGPRPLQEMISDLLASSERVKPALSMLISSGISGSADELSDALMGDAMSRIGQLEKVLGEAQGTQLRAANRLTLENKVRQIRFELESMRLLIELLDRASECRVTELRLDELVSATMNMLEPMPWAPGITVRVSNAVSNLDTLVIADAHVAMRLVALAISAVAKAGAEAVEIGVDGPVGVMATVTVRRVPLSQDATICIVPVISETACAVARLAAQRIGAQVKCSDGHVEVCVRFAAVAPLSGAR